MNSKMAGKLAESVRAARQLNDSKESVIKPETGKAVEDKNEVKVLSASRRVWPD